MPLARGAGWTHDVDVDPDLLKAFRRRARAVAEADLEREDRAAEELRRSTIDKLVRAIEAARAEGRCARVWLFGSFAWGKPEDRSDVDLLVEACRDPDALTAEVWRACDRPVHVVELDRAPDSLRERVLREGTLL